jgi:hypothetical protein
MPLVARHPRFQIPVVLSGRYCVAAGFPSCMVSRTPAISFLSWMQAKATAAIGRGATGSASRTRVPISTLVPPAIEGDAQAALRGVAATPPSLGSRFLQTRPIVRRLLVPTYV